MREARFKEYIDRFNERDATAFDEFLAHDVHVQNGTLHFDGVQGMKEHYRKIWKDFEEKLYPSHFTTDADPNGTVAIRMGTDFTALHDAEGSLFGPVNKGEKFRFDGVIMYTLRDDKFTGILVAYNNFIHTDAQGNSRDLGIPH